jgi:hypothetical protein
VIELVNICWRKSGPVSITIEVLSDSIKKEVRSRLSFILAERQTSHEQAITGTPCEVPVPRNIPFIVVYKFKD